MQHIEHIKEDCAHSLQPCLLVRSVLALVTTGNSNVFSRHNLVPVPPECIANLILFLPCFLSECCDTNSPELHTSTHHNHIPSTSILFHQVTLALREKSWQKKGTMQVERCVLFVVSSRSEHYCFPHSLLFQLSNHSHHNIVILITHFYISKSSLSIFYKTITTFQDKSYI